MHFITISHCNRGKVDYQKVLRTDSSSVINWDKPFCMLKPRIGGQSIEEESQDDEDSFIGVFGFFMMKGKKVQNLLRKKIDLNFEKLTNGKWIEYSGKSKQTHFQTPFESFTHESQNLICYKMARRKRYAKRKISFYIPKSFVGGLFQCFIPRDLKSQIINDFLSNSTDDLIIQQFDFQCDPQLSTPILPLIAEDSTMQWFENKVFNIFNPQLIQFIPYLSTSMPYDVRFSMFDTPDMYKDTWAKKIDINERYNYNEADIHVISKSITYSANLLNKLISPIDFNNLIKSYNRADGKENPDFDISINQHEMSYFEKLSLWLGLINRDVVNRVLVKLEHHWNQISE